MNLDNNNIKYRVMVEGRIISEHTNKILAEAAILGLAEDTKNKAVIIPILSDGKTLLMG